MAQTPQTLLPFSGYFRLKYTYVYVSKIGYLLIFWTLYLLADSHTPTFNIVLLHPHLWLLLL